MNTDVFSQMLGADGLPRPELFVEDQLHMNGYALSTRILKPLLESVTTPVSVQRKFPKVLKLTFRWRLGDGTSGG